MPAIIKLSPDATVTFTVTANDVDPPTDPFVQFELPDGRIVSFQSEKMNVYLNCRDLILVIECVSLVSQRIYLFVSKIQFQVLNSKCGPVQETMYAPPDTLMAGSTFQTDYTFTEDLVGEQTVRIQITNHVSLETAMTSATFMRQVEGLEVSSFHFYFNNSSFVRVITSLYLK